MSAPQIRLLGAVPRVVLARLQMFFNTNKTFLLPTALPAVQKLREIYADNSPGKLLVVGHADTAGDAAYNDKLSLARAKATIAFLEDDFQTWLDSYDSSVDPKQRWGKVEDHLMIISMPDFDTKPKGDDAVSWYQSTRKLAVDGKAGTQTRTALIQEYMSLDGASLEDSGIEIEAIAHGCGENFPLDDSGENLDSAPANDKPDPIDRRVELFFFDAEFGIVPAPPGDNSGPGSTQYPKWRKRVEETVELRADDVDGPKVTFIEMADAHFRTNSAVVLPEGENPDQTGAHQALTSVGVIATALRFNDEHPGRTLLVAGHTDTTADPAFNQPLSEERAQLTLAMLKGGDDSRETFKNLAQGRHTVADIKQILSWISTAFAPLSFDCDPGKIDDNLATATGPVRNFQRDFNTNKSALGSSAEDLNVDGSVGLLTWGAFFDCYEFALQQELGEDAPGVQALRDQLVFADPQHEFLGFSEYFPIDELGVDNFRSQTNRRVEIHFFEKGEEPDIAHAADDPETSDLYLPGHYERTPLEPMVSAKPWIATWDAPTTSLGTTRNMAVNAPGIPAGTPLVFTLLLNSEPLRIFNVAASADTASLPYRDWEPPDDVIAVSLSAGQEFQPATYEFTVEGGGRLVSSRNSIAYSDRVFVKLMVDPGDGGPQIPLANENYVLQVPWGERTGQTDAQGVLDEQNVPPGGASLLLRGRHMMPLGVLPHNWDIDP